MSEITASRDNRRRRPRGYAGWRPHARTQHLLTQVEAVLAEYREYVPLTVRQIFYRLVGAFGYEKTENAYGRLGEHLNRARRAGRIPFEAIRDDGVVTQPVDYYGSPDDFWDETGKRVKRYRRDRQVGQPIRIELWCEAAGMLGQLARVAAEYSVPVYSCGGFNSLSANYEVARRALDRNRPTLLLHVGDHDPSGEAIFDALAEDAAAFVQTDRIIGTQAIHAERVALTAEQIDKYSLPTAPPKKSDSRSGRWRGETAQLEALPPDLLASLVREAIESHFDAEKFRAECAAEKRDRISLLRALPAGD